MCNSTNDHSGIGAVAGFGYQDYYFLLRLLKMQSGEIASYEKIDDVALEQGDSLKMYQLKHTVKGYGSKIVRLNNKDADLWKTIAVWIDIITKKGDRSQQFKFIEEGEFILVTNKSVASNSFVSELNKYKDSCVFDDIDKLLSDFYNSSFDPDHENSEDKVENLTQIRIRTLKEFDLKKEFLKKVSVENTSVDDLKEQIYRCLEVEKYTPKENVKAVYTSLLGEVNDMKAETILKGKPLDISSEEFARKYSSIFHKYRGKPYNPKRYDYVTPPNPYKMTFLSQLVDIDDIAWDEIDLINEYYQRRLSFENNYNAALKHISNEDQKNFKNDVYNAWRTRFRFHNNPLKESSSEEQIREKARIILQEIRDKKIFFAEQQLDEYHSNGCYYLFSDGDDPLIGWHRDWKTKYKKNYGL